MSSQNQLKCNQRPKIARPHWSDIEIEALQAAYEKHGPNWKLIQQELPGRSIQQCVQKWKRIKPIELIKQCRWSETEDCKLKDLYLKYGSSWNLIAQQMGNRNAVQVRQRYMNKLNPNNKSGKWMQEEDDKLFDLYSKVGSRWSYIGQQLGGRADNDVKNRFYSKKNSRNPKESELNQMDKSSKKLRINDDNSIQNEKNQNSLKDNQQSRITEKQLSSIHQTHPNQPSTQIDQELLDPQESVQLSIQLNEPELIFYQSISEQYDSQQMNLTNNGQFNLGQQCFTTFQPSFNQNLEYESSFQFQSQTISSPYATHGSLGEGSFNNFTFDFLDHDFNKN